MPIKYVRYRLNDEDHYGRLEGETIQQLAGAPYDGEKATGEAVALTDVTLLPPSEPSKVIAVGLNFRSHAGERGAEKPELFAKLPSSLVGHGGNIEMPADSTNLHYEGELVVVIGKLTKNINKDQVKDHIFAITCGNDVSERVWQQGDVQWLRAKASDTFGPTGPHMVAGVDYNDLLLESRVNGEVRQSERTTMLIHNVDEIVSFTSRYFTLLPGDMIFTGTPGKTSALEDGDVVEVEIEGIGTLRNPVTKA
jgi:2-keto-4-pentenoate hydratase/2-oxohepta-3-ene-1,7-dioic acid hydratase in catechol pathway